LVPLITKVERENGEQQTYQFNVHSSVLALFSIDIY